MILPRLALMLQNQQVFVPIVITMETKISDNYNDN